jgi:hypothetical protein
LFRFKGLYVLIPFQKSPFVLLILALAFWTPAVHVAILDGLAVLIGTIIQMQPDRHDCERPPLEEKEVTAPPPSVAKMEAENLNR